MAIKGKKKSQVRGSQARRRPASAPRPASSRRRTAWYSTDRGRLIVAAVAVVVIGVVWWAIAHSRAAAADLERRQDAVETYTGEARALLQSVRPAAAAMAQVPAAPDRGPPLQSISQAAGSWTGLLDKARSEAGAIVPTPFVISAHELFSQSVDLYLSAAKTYRLGGRAGRSVANGLLARAAQQRDQAGAIWLLATRVLDDARSEAELSASGLGLPSAVPAGGAQPTLPSPEPSPAASGADEERGSKHDKNDKNGHQGGD
jgi:hypothetical protein